MLQNFFKGKRGNLNRSTILKKYKISMRRCIVDYMNRLTKLTASSVGQLSLLIIIILKSSKELLFRFHQRS